ncbi:MAG TPA: aminoacyl--tRNA ligase-related protein, partial [Candidatus Babeliales bacterium]|nr:aminoacyl--tRNA ligase-related protein [Candidatus Babeliales bacterium]
MLDIRFIRENADLVAEKSKQKGYEVDIQKLLELDNNRRKVLTEIESTRNLRNQHAKQGLHPDGSSQGFEVGKNLKEKLNKLEDQLRPIDGEFNKLLAEVPNVFPDDTPLGGEEDNVEIKTWGEAKKGETKDHLTWAEEHGMLDFERGAKVAGNKFYYMKAGLVELELALLQFTLNFVKNKGFYPMVVPHMVNTKTLEGAGFSARGNEKQIYKVEDEDLNLIATAEIPLTGFFAGEIIPTNWLPSKMSAWSPSYRAEGGAYGKYNRGLFRVHQFNKVE